MIYDYAFHLNSIFLDCENTGDIMAAPRVRFAEEDEIIGAHGELMDAAWVQNFELTTRPGHRLKHRISRFKQADSMLAPSQWDTALLCNDVSHWLGASLDSGLALSQWETALLCNDVSHWLDASPESALLRYMIHIIKIRRSWNRVIFVTGTP